MKPQRRFLIEHPLEERDLEEMHRWLAIYESEVQRVVNVCEYFKEHKLVEVKDGVH